MNAQETRKLRDEILNALAANSSSFVARAARAYRAGLTTEQIMEKYGYDVKTVKLSQHDVQMFMDGTLPYATPAYAKNVSGFYRDALNFSDQLSIAALLYTRVMLSELHEIDPTVLLTPLGQMRRPESRESRKRYAPTCSECFTQHAGECD